MSLCWRTLRKSPPMMKFLSEVGMTTKFKPMFPHSVDSTLLAAFRACPQKFFLSYVEHWKSVQKSVHLVAGGAFASAIEAAREAFYVEGKSDSDAEAIGMTALIEHYGDFDCPPESAKSLERMLGAFEFYLFNYPLGGDGAEPYHTAFWPPVVLSFLLPNLWALIILLLAILFSILVAVIWLLIVTVRGFGTMMKRQLRLSGLPGVVSGRCAVSLPATTGLCYSKVSNPRAPSSVASPSSRPSTTPWKSHLPRSARNRPVGKTNPARHPQDDPMLGRRILGL